MAFTSIVPINLRPYQGDLIAQASAALKEYRRLLIQLSTGGGKTVIASFLTLAIANRGRALYFVCHRKELIEQTSLTFTSYGIDHGIIAPGHPRNTQKLVQICSIDTLGNICDKIATPWACIFDEVHHAGADGWSEIINHFYEEGQGARIIGLTATPCRLDGKGLGEHFDIMIEGPSTAELIEMGALSEYRYFKPPVTENVLVGNAVAHWKEYAAGMRTVVFAKNRGHSKQVVEEFLAAGVAAAHLDANTPTGERRRIIQAYARGEILVLSNVDLFGEGFDLAAIAQMPVTIDCAMLLRRTESLALFLQWCGRALRPAPGKTAIILDHAGNWFIHGEPRDERIWSLEGDSGARKPSDPGIRPPITCPKCHEQHAFPWPDRCPTEKADGSTCGHVFRRIEGGPGAPIEVIDGVLEEATEADRRSRAAEAARELDACETLSDFQDLAVRMKKRNAMAWAYEQWGKRHHRADLRAA